MSSSYSKLPAASSSSPVANPFLQAQEVARQQHQRDLETRSEWEKKNEERTSRMEAWLNDCPHELRADLRQEIKTKVVQQAGWARPCVNDLPYPREVIRRVESKWLESIGCDAFSGPSHQEHNHEKYKQLCRLKFLIQSLCQDHHLKRKSWVQEAIDLAIQLGFEDLARNVIPHIRAWRQEFCNSHQ